jgi:3-oxoacyl-[acyl-carrier protein] reductase
MTKDFFDFQDKRVVVTGGSRGIGEAIAREFASRGARVAVLARNVEQAEKTASSLGDKCRSWAVDVSDESSVADAFGSIAEEWGGIDILINNAGITRDNLLMRQSVDDWNQVMDINLRGVFLCSRAVLRPMIKARGGRIINVTSVVGLVGNPGQANYAASKAGIVGFTKSLAREVASRSITINAVAPGLVDTDMTRAMKDDARTQLLGAIPMGRFGESDEIAAACLFLASDAAAYITGEVLRVDGGMAM